MALYKQAPQPRKMGESKSDRISLRWKEHVWHFHNEGPWSNVGLMSWWEVTAVWKRLAFFTPTFLDKLLKRSVEQADEMRAWWRWVGMVTSHKNKSNPPCGIPFMLSHWSVCFAFSVLVGAEGPLEGPWEGRGIKTAKFNSVPRIKISQMPNVSKKICLVFSCVLVFQRNSKVWKKLHSHVGAICGFAAFKLMGAFWYAIKA